MIGYVTLGTNDFDAAVEFYDALLAVLGAKRLWQTERVVAWGTSMNAALLSVSKPFDGKAASVGNGVMVALQVADQAQVDAVYAKALELGGTDEGKAGPRGDSGFYAGYFRDLDGNKLNAFILG